jgi:hypothetical protein
LPGDLEVVHVGVRDVGRRAGVERATVFGIMSCTGYCESSTLTPVFASYFLIASNSASSSDL